KVYEAEVEGEPREEALQALRTGVELEDGTTAPAEARLLETADGAAVLGLTLHEGRKHQVKRMCAAVGHPVLRLHRSRHAGIGLGELAPGEWRELTASELKALQEAA